MIKDKAVKPLMSECVRYKVGLIRVRTPQAHCPRCSFNLFISPEYTPDFCSNCGQSLEWLGIHINKDQFLGYVDDEVIAPELVNKAVVESMK